MNIGEIELAFMYSRDGIARYQSPTGAHSYDVPLHVFVDAGLRIPVKITIKIWVDT